MKHFTEMKQTIKLWNKLVKENKNKSSFTFYRSIYYGNHLVIRMGFDFFEFNSLERINVLRMSVAYKYEYARFFKEWEYKLDSQDLDFEVIKETVNNAINEFDELKRRWNE